jgi:hypothetical protein
MSKHRHDVPVDSALPPAELVRAADLLDEVADALEDDDLAVSDSLRVSAHRLRTHAAERSAQ